MKNLRLDDCPNCDVKLELLYANDNKILHCNDCGYEQLRETSERVENITDSLCEILFGKGIDKILIKNEELEIEVALRSDAVLPLIVDRYIRQNNDDDFFYKVISDKKALLKYRVIYIGGSNNIESDVQNILNVILYLYTETRKQRPEDDRYIDLNIIFDEDINSKAISSQNSSEINVDYSKGAPHLSEVKYPFVISMVEERSEASQLGLFKALKKEGVDLIKISDVINVKEVLNNEFPWFKDVTEVIFSQLAVRQQGDNVFRITPLLLLGKPGVGKTAYCSRLAELSLLPYRILSLAGSISNQVLAGTDRGFTSAKASFIVQTILDYKVGNPMIILDELDKAGGSAQNGHPVHTLLGMLEPSSSKNWLDPFLMGHVNLSFVNWIATANDIGQLPKTLLSRLRVINVEGPKPEHYPAIINRTRQTFAKDNGIDIKLIPQFGEVEWNWIEQYYKTPRMARKATEVLVRNMVLGGPGQSVH